MTPKELTRIANLLYFDAMHKKNVEPALQALGGWERTQVVQMLDKIRTLGLLPDDIKNDLQYLIQGESGSYYEAAFIRYHKARNKARQMVLF